MHVFWSRYSKCTRCNHLEIAVCGWCWPIWDHRLIQLLIHCFIIPRKFINKNTSLILWLFKKYEKYMLCLYFENYSGVGNMLCPGICNGLKLAKNLKPWINSKQFWIKRGFLFPLKNIYSYAVIKTCAVS